MKFKEKYLAGEILFEEIDTYIEAWGNSDDTCTLREYLGLNEEEEDVWISDSEEALIELLDRQIGRRYRSRKAAQRISPNGLTGFLKQLSKDSIPL